MNAFWAQVIAAFVGAITTGGVRYLSTYLPRRAEKRAEDSRPGKLVVEDAETE